jgi:hypothetical protein
LVGNEGRNLPGVQSIGVFQEDHETFNTAVKDGTVGKKMQKILEEAKAEAVYFTGYDGHPSATMIVNVEDLSQVPAFAEPWISGGRV